MAVGDQVRGAGEPVERAHTRAAWSDGLAGLALGLIGLALWGGAHSVYEHKPTLGLGLGTLVVAVVVIGIWSSVRDRAPVARWARLPRGAALTTLVVVATVVIALTLTLP